MRNVGAHRPLGKRVRWREPGDAAGRDMPKNQFGRLARSEDRVRLLAQLAFAVVTNTPFECWEGQSQAISATVEWLENETSRGYSPLPS